MLSASEALALGMVNGLDTKVLSEIMRRSSGGNLGAGETQTPAGRDGDRACFQKVRGWLWHRPDAEGLGPGPRERACRAGRYPGGWAGCF